MIIIYNEKEIEEILREHHSYGKRPIKVGYDHKEIDTVTITESRQVLVLLKEEDDES